MNIHTYVHYFFIAYIYVYVYIYMYIHIIWRTLAFFCNFTLGTMIARSSLFSSNPGLQLPETKDTKIQILNPKL